MNWYRKFVVKSSITQKPPLKKKPKLIIQPISAVHKTVADKVSREVDILTEIAELQIKLIEKLGKKADLGQHQEALSDSSNHFRITKESVVRSIKDEIYSKRKAIIPNGPEIAGI